MRPHTLTCPAGSNRKINAKRRDVARLLRNYYSHAAGVSQSVAVWCIVLQCVAVKSTRNIAMVPVSSAITTPMPQVCCSVLQCVAVCCSEIDAKRCDVARLLRHYYSHGAGVLQSVAVWRIVLQRDAACCSVLQCVVVCCSGITAKRCSSYLQLLQ